MSQAPGEIGKAGPFVHTLSGGRAEFTITDEYLCECGHSRDQHADLTDEDAAGYRFQDTGCFECDCDYFHVPK